MGARFFAGLLVAALSLAAFGPAAFAQAEVGGDVQYIDCSQVQNVVVNQGQYANANADEESEAVAKAAQELNITQNQVNACLGDVNLGDGERDGDDGGDGGGEGERTVVDGETIILDDVAAATLPKTGGPSFSGLLLASGCALLGAGLVLNRIAR